MLCVRISSFVLILAAVMLAAPSAEAQGRGKGNRPDLPPEAEAAMKAAEEKAEAEAKAAEAKAEAAEKRAKADERRREALEKAKRKGKPSEPPGLAKQREKKAEQHQKELGKGSPRGQEARGKRRKWWKLWGEKTEEEVEAPEEPVAE
ncbi:hypothetical protein ACFLQY_03745 [Verrucomicrobiota bacterium]